MSKNIDDIVAGCKRNKRKFQAQLYHQFADQLNNAAIRYGSAPENVRDFVHDAFIKILTKIGAYNGSGFQVYKWMLRILINEILQQKRREHKITYVDSHEEQFVDYEIDPVIEKMTLDEIWLLVKKMDYNDQLIINFSLVDELTHSEISEILNISIQSSRTRLSRAKANLRTLISKQVSIKDEISK